MEEKENKTQILLYRKYYYLFLLLLLTRTQIKLLYTCFLASNPFLGVMFTFPGPWGSNIDSFGLVWVGYSKLEAS